MNKTPMPWNQTAVKIKTKKKLRKLLQNSNPDLKLKILEKVYWKNFKELGVFLQVWKEMKQKNIEKQLNHSLEITHQVLGKVNKDIGDV